MPRTIDLNLLRVLQALLEERGVSRAAERLGMSQPATSAALAKLRRHFNDELLTRVGNGYQLTPLAARLAERTPGAIAMADRVFWLQPEFEPSTSRREFVVMLSDHAIQVLGGPVTRLLSAQAPDVRLHLWQITSGVVDDAPDSLRDVDAVVLPHGVLTDLPYQDLLSDEWVCLVAEDNQVVGDELTAKHLTELPWVFIYHRRTAFTTAVRELRTHGIEPRAQIVSESYRTLPALIAGTDRVTLVQARLGRALAQGEGVRVLPCPVPLGPLKLALWWHPSNTADPGHRWLREVFTNAAAPL